MGKNNMPKKKKLQFINLAKNQPQNDKKVAYKVGRAYLEGKGVSKSYKKAHNWFRRSANKNMYVPNTISAPCMKMAWAYQKITVRPLIGTSEH